MNVRLETSFNCWATDWRKCKLGLTQNYMLAVLTGEQICVINNASKATEYIKLAQRKRGPTCWPIYVEKLQLRLNMKTSLPVLPIPEMQIHHLQESVMVI